MIDIRIRDGNTEYVRVSRATARKHYDNGDCVLVVGCDMRPGYPWNPGVYISREYNDGENFDTVDARAAYYHTGNGQGRYLAYYLVCVARPLASTYANNHRDCVRYYRAVSAYEAAYTLTNGHVTERAYEAAYDLLARCTRYALAQTRHDESETEYTYRSEWVIHESELLDARRARLETELAPYGLAFHCLGYFCHNVYQTNADGTVSGYGYLHFF